MSLLLLNLRFAGFLLTILGLAHSTFPKRFGWHEEFDKLSPLSGQIHHVHNFFIGLMVLLNGVLCLFFAEDLLKPSRLSAAVLVALSVFWIARLIVQLFVYGPELWRGKPFETRIHIIFTLFWTYLSAVFSTAAFRVLSGLIIS